MKIKRKNWFIEQHRPIRKKEKVFDENLVIDRDEVVTIWGTLCTVFHQSIYCLKLNLFILFWRVNKKNKSVKSRQKKRVKQIEKNALPWCENNQASHLLLSETWPKTNSPALMNSSYQKKKNPDPILLLST